MKRLFVNSEPCVGCLNCVAACEQRHAGAADSRARALRVIVRPFTGIHEFIYCRQCAEAACAKSCPRAAIVRDEVTGAWRVERALCVPCGTCAAACPFGALSFHRELGPIKCDLCSEALSSDTLSSDTLSSGTLSGAALRCVEACHFGVLSFVEDAVRSACRRGIPLEDLDPLLGRG